MNYGRTPLDELLSYQRQGPRPMPIDLYQDEDNYVLSADLPGVDPGSIDIDADEHMLTIRAERTAETQHEARWIAKEKPTGSFLREFTLGRGIDSEKISANYDNGVLSIILPMTTREKRKIAIQTPESTRERQPALTG